MTTDPQGLRRSSPLVAVLTAAALLGCAWRRPAPVTVVVQPAPVPDLEAIREATRVAPGRHYVSALAYRHFVDAP